MATGNTTARNSRASDFAADYATATLTIFEGATTLATHTLTGFGAPATGVITPNPIADATIVASSVTAADSATISSAAGTYTLTVGTSGADLNLSTLTYVTGETSSITSLAITFSA